MPAMRLSGWGRHPVAECEVFRPSSPAVLAHALKQLPDAIARGNGRSYGDASLNVSATLDIRRLDRLLEFDAATGTVTCEGGLLLAELIDAMLPRGWFPPVTPGTQYVTIGGMIASDVHGKNHHGAGSFADHLLWVDLDIGEGPLLRCSRSENPDLFAATCGGMGLTGVIVRTSFRMLRIATSMVRQRRLRAPTLDHAIAVFEESLAWTYSVAWIDCLAQRNKLGRSTIMLGEHARASELPQSRQGAPLIRRPRRARRIPLDLPRFALSRTPVRLFNQLYYAVQSPCDLIVELDSFFYPLDALLDWNRIYGRRGFVQYQCVLPLPASRSGLGELLTTIASAGEASFLAVLKRMGRESFGLLSFPMEGYTLALDFPASTANLALLDRLDSITVAHGGRIYLAKDARASAATVAAGYPRLDAFRAVRSAHGLDRRFSSLLSRRLQL
jgi:decaprenylphospho-beta-D-ribofuranose 2-oxidase